MFSTGVRPRTNLFSFLCLCCLTHTIGIKTRRAKSYTGAPSHLSCQIWHRSHRSHFAPWISSWRPGRSLRAPLWQLDCTPGAEVGGVLPKAANGANQLNTRGWPPCRELVNSLDSTDSSGSSDTHPTCRHFHGEHLNTTY